MFNNRLSIVTIFGTFLLCTSLFLLSIGGQIHFEISTNLHGDSEEQLARNTFLLLGILLMVTGIGFILKQHWARIASIFFCMIIMLIWTIFVYSVYESGGRENWILAGCTVLVFGGAILGLFLLNNIVFLKNYYPKFEDHSPEQEKFLGVDDIIIPPKS